MKKLLLVVMTALALTSCKPTTGYIKFDDTAQYQPVHKVDVVTKDGIHTTMNPSQQDFASIYEMNKDCKWSFKKVQGKYFYTAVCK